MKFTTAASVENVVWEMRLADYPRALNRAALNDLYNGAPPYTGQEVAQNNINTNVNFLDGTRILHDARRQMYSAFLTADPLFNISVDCGPTWKRMEWSNHLTKNINRIIRQSRDYLELRRSIFASMVLHGIGPSMWQTRMGWCPRPVGIEDVLIPSNTLVSMENLPFFAIYRQYTGAELYKLTHGPKRDRAWNLPMAEAAIRWVDTEAKRLMSASWPETWSPEKMSERIKQDGGLYSSDAVPTIDTFDVYFWNDDGKEAGWNRRIILDAWGSPGVGGAGAWSNAIKDGKMPEKNYIGTRNQFLYDPGDRVYGAKLEEIIQWQFADLSCVAPFRYHSVRGLGLLLYAVCHLENRLRCKFDDHVFENLLQYFRVSNPADAERLTKIDLVDKGIIPDGLNFVKQEERWQVNEGVIDRAFEMNRQTLQDNAASFAQDLDIGEKAETATRTMAKVNASAAMVGAMIGQAYEYQRYQYIEICRRFCIKNSPDKDVRKFRVQCFNDGVPAEALDVERWDVEPVRTIGQGNKMLQVAMADRLMAIWPKLSAPSQKMVERIYITANTDDAALAVRLVPDQKGVSPTVVQAQNDAGTLMLGLPVAMEPNVNETEYIEAQMHSMATKMQQVELRGGMATAEEVTGLSALITNIGRHIQVLAQDNQQRQRVRKYGEDLKNLTNMVKGYAQRLQQQQKKQQANGDGGEAAVKLQTQVLLAQNKAKLAADSHAQKTAQRQVAFEQQMQQDAQRHRQELAKTDLEAAANIRRGGMKSLAE